MAKHLTEFQRGVLYAASIVQMTANEPGIAADILRSAGYTELDCSSLDDCDKEALRVVNQEKEMQLRGLHEVQHLTDDMIRCGDRLALKGRERVSDVPTRYRTSWSVVRIQEFEAQTPEAIDEASIISVTGNGLTTVRHSFGQELHYATVEVIAKNINKPAALKLLA